jgi:hypothetical protein
MTINVQPTTEFLPTDVSDAGLAELRRLAVCALKASTKFAVWLHGWTDTEQARRGRGETTCTARHAFCLPQMGPWTDVDAAGALEATAVLVHNLNDWSASQFAERLQLAVAYDCARRLRGEKSKPEGVPDAN